MTDDPTGIQDPSQDPQLPQDPPAASQPPETPPETPPAPPAEDQVTLSKGDYNQMMAIMATMQAQLQNQQRQAPEPPAPKEPTAEELEHMTGQQLLQHIQQQQAPLIQTVMNMAVQMELRDVRDAHSDFKNYENEVLKLATANTSLSLEDAYQLAKAKAPKPATQEPTLPPATPNPRPSTNNNPPPASRRSTTPSATQADEKLDTRAAAIAAAKELGIE